MLLSPRLSAALAFLAATFLSHVTMRFIFFRFCRNAVMKGQEDSVCVLSNPQMLQHSSSDFQKTLNILRFDKYSHPF